MTTPAYHQLDLSWTAPAPACGWTPRGFHVYRSRWDGTSYSGAPIRLTSQDQPATSTSLRLSYPPITSGHDPASPTSADFVGPPGFRAATELPPTYRVTTVNMMDQEGDFSDGVRAHTDATFVTLSYQDPATTSGPMNERSGAALFAHADPNDTGLIPGAPSGLSWTWHYGRKDAGDIAPEGRNWAVVKWEAPATGVVNDYHLLRKTATDADFVEVPQVGFIPGDDLGIRQFLWEMPLELACEDAEYRIRGEDVFGRSGAESSSLVVGKRKLIPESLRAEQVSGNDHIKVKWDLLPVCGTDSTHYLNGYVVVRSAAYVELCTDPSPDPDDASLWVEVGRTTATKGVLDVPPPNPSHEGRRFWYRVKALWGATEQSGYSSMICANKTGDWPEGGPSAELTLPGSMPDAWEIAKINEPDADRGVCSAPAESEQITQSEEQTLATGSACQPALGIGLTSEAGGVPSPHRVIGQSASTNPPVRLYFYHLDHLGTPRVITDVDGQLVSKHKYLPFGEELAPDTINPPAASTNTHKFTGHERDIETGMDYMLARYYWQQLNRFGSVDLDEHNTNGANPQTYNRYAYTANNPINRLDPDGRNWFQTTGGWQWRPSQEGGYTHLLQVTAIGANPKTGAVLFNMTLFDQNQPELTRPGYSGGAEGSARIPAGSYLIKGDLKSPPPTTINSDSTLHNPPPAYGIQAIGPEPLQDPVTGLYYNVQTAYGPMRAYLEPLSENPTQEEVGNYFHGQTPVTGVTHGCLSYGADPAIIYHVDEIGKRVPVAIDVSVSLEVKK